MTKLAEPDTAISLLRELWNDPNVLGCDLGLAVRINDYLGPDTALSLLQEVADWRHARPGPHDENALSADLWTRVERFVAPDVKI